MAVDLDTRARRTGAASGDDNHGGGGTLLLVAALGAVGVGGYLLIKHEEGSPSPTPTPVGPTPTPVGACPGCATTSPALAPGIYETCSVPGNPSSCTLWRVAQDPSGKMVRYGYTTPANFLRCEGSNPPVTTSGFGFGDGDTSSFVGTVQDISAGCACPPGALAG